MSRSAAADEERRSRVAASLKRRYGAERRFRLYGQLAVLVGLGFVVLLFVSIFSKGYSAFEQTYVRLDVSYDAEILDPAGTRKADDLADGDYGAIVKAALRSTAPDVESRAELKQLYALVSNSAPRTLQARISANPALVGTHEPVWVLASDRVDQIVKGYIGRDESEEARGVSDQQLKWIDALRGKGALERRFNRQFFTGGDSREPEQAGVAGAVAGSFFTLVVTLLLSFPIGVAAAVYLEEFAPKNRYTDFIEVNINNLAAVPSIVFGLLGLAVFVQFFGLPRSIPLVGGLVLTLMTLPTIIIASRAALKAFSAWRARSAKARRCS